MDTSRLRRRVVGRLRNGTVAWPLAFLLTGLGLAFGRYGDLRWGNAAPNPDVTRMFYPIASRVASGATLYGPGLADNKPPGWQLANVAVAVAGEYTFGMLLLVGVANGATAALLWYWLDDAGAPGVAVASGVLFLLALPLLGGNTINSRPIMVAFVLLGLVASRPAVRGLAVAAAALVNAYAAAFVPVLLWAVWREGAAADGAGTAADGAGATADGADADAGAGDQSPIRDAFAYLFAGATLGVGTFAAVGAIWGVEATSAALHWSYGVPLLPGVETSAVHPDATSPGSYLAGTWLITQPGRWLMYTGTVLAQLFPLVPLAWLGWIHRDRLEAAAPDAALLALSLAAALFPLLFRSYEQYWLVPLPFVAVLAATGVVALSDGRPSE
ncbi:hypothetical protein [Haloparvum sp. PAK95]|uniref:hypothetical protein n=1 Tax=Haloparvum sp. PAK95 TaxID=3418962 RepID=UPI003D2F0691